MKSIKRRFKQLEIKNPYWSTQTCFAEAVAGQNFSSRTIRHWFNKLVSKDDYAPSDKKGILGYLQILSKRPDDNQKLG